MEILIEDIPEEGLEIEATEAQAWLGRLAGEAIGEGFRSGDRAALKVSIHCIGGNVNIDGDFSVTCHSTCDRCIAVYGDAVSIPLHAVLAPLYESERQRKSSEGEEVELVKEDLEFGFYEGDRFDLEEVVREQVVLALPMKHLCREDCKGLCQRCGKDLNEGPCGCVEKSPDPRWNALKSLKLKGGGRKA